jgi:hypothetical protein
MNNLSHTHTSAFLFPSQNIISVLALDNLPWHRESVLHASRLVNPGYGDLAYLLADVSVQEALGD